MHAYRTIATASKSEGKATPTALIMEPSRELAQQTYDNIVLFCKFLPNPKPRAVLLIGGVDAKDQVRQLDRGCDIVVGTPGRMMDMIEGNKFSLSKVMFFCLDEADNLLDTGNYEMIMKIHARIPKQAKRLQMLLFSATLHSQPIRNISDTLMKFATWVDLKGRDAVPETVHHALVRIDPDQADVSWATRKVQVETDGIHAVDRSRNLGKNTPEARSERVKLLKAQKLLDVVDALKMEQCMIFVRTKQDADNLENFFITAGNGRKFRAGQESGKEHEYSCVVLHGDRSVQERGSNLDAFKRGAVRFLICTDVAARGIDVQGLPFMINYTLPDKAEDYIHRVGRVGRADSMGLAISLVATTPEKVWYHSCPSKGKSCNNSKLTSEGGCAIWYDEPSLLRDIEKRLQQTVVALGDDYSVKFEDPVKYGQKRKLDNGPTFQSHVELLRPAVKTLGRLEEQTQLSFLNLKRLFMQGTRG